MAEEYRPKDARRVYADRIEWIGEPDSHGFRAVRTEDGRPCVRPAVEFLEVGYFVVISDKGEWTESPECFHSHYELAR